MQGACAHPEVEELRDHVSHPRRGGGPGNGQRRIVGQPARHKRPEMGVPGVMQGSSLAPAPPRFRSGRGRGLARPHAAAVARIGRTVEPG
jgi:hypothetical protein